MRTMSSALTIVSFSPAVLPDPRRSKSLPALVAPLPDAGVRHRRPWFLRRQVAGIRSRDPRAMHALGAAIAAKDTETAGHIERVGDLTVTFVAALGKRAVPLMTANYSSLTGGTVAVAETTPGVNASARGAPKGATLTDTTNGKQYINTGTAAAPTWTVVGSQS